MFGVQRVVAPLSGGSRRLMPSRGQFSALLELLSLGWPGGEH